MVDQGAREIDPGDALSFVEAELTEPKDWQKACATCCTWLADSVKHPQNPEDLIVPAREGTLLVKINDCEWENGFAK
jgi:hypothetical protein